MAAANKTTKTVKKTVEVEEEIVELTLSVAEARAVYRALGQVTGDSFSDDAPCKHAADVWAQLRCIPAVASLGIGSNRINATGTVRLDKGTTDLRPF